MFDCSQIVIDRKAPEPLHIQLVKELRRLIRELDQKEYGVLPSERSLCAQLNLHRKTVHKAYEELLNSGIVSQEPNKSLQLTSSARKRLEGSLPAIGVVLPNRFSRFVANRPHTLLIMEGIFDRAAERNYAVFLLELPPPETSEAERQHFISSRFSGLTGILLLGDRGCDNDLMLSELFCYKGIPQVAITGEIHQEHIGSVQCCFDNAAEDMVRFFKSRGVRSIGIVDCEITHFRQTGYDYSSRYRAAKMREIFQRHNFILPEKWQLRADFSNELFSSKLPEAFWCFNDAAAIRLLNALRARNSKLQTLVAGFDGILSDPDLATIRQPYPAIGAKAVDLLLEHYEHGITPENRIQYADAEFVLPCNLQNFHPKWN